MIDPPVGQSNYPHISLPCKRHPICLVASSHHPRNTIRQMRPIDPPPLTISSSIRPTSPTLLPTRPQTLTKFYPTTTLGRVPPLLLLITLSKLSDYSEEDLQNILTRETTTSTEYLQETIPLTLTPPTPYILPKQITFHTPKQSQSGANAPLTKILDLSPLQEIYLSNSQTCLHRGAPR